MTLTPEQMDALAEKARKATPGPWYVVGPPWNNEVPWINAGSDDPHRYLPVCDFDARLDAETDVEVRDDRSVHSDAAFIAACSPDVILALVQQVRDAERERDGMREYLHDICDAYEGFNKSSELPDHKEDGDEREQRDGRAGEFWNDLEEAIERASGARQEP